MQTGGLISFVNDTHVDKNLKEILVFVYYGPIVNNRPNEHHKVESQESWAGILSELR